MHFIYYYFISLSILGYGIFFNNFLNINSKNLGIIGFIGIFLLLLFSYVSTFFIAHDYHLNLTIFLIGFLLFLYFLVKNSFNKKDLTIFFLVFLFIFIFILNGKNHDDFPYYHFPYTYLLTQDSHPFGLGQINNGFRNPSSIFFFNSLFYLPKIDIYLLHIGAVFFLGFTNLFFLKNIFNHKSFRKEKFYNLINLFFLVYINVFFYRLAEYGTDRLGSILVILAFIIILRLTNQSLRNSFNERNELTKFLFIIGVIAISMKPFYLIYISLIFFFIYYKHLNLNLFEFFNSRLALLIVIFAILSFTINFINSGCFLFPAKFTCLENVSWSIPKQEVEDVKIWYELWSKGGATPNFVVDNRQSYISNFNWFSNWIDIYFFNKVSDYLLSIIFISFIFYLFFRSKKKIKNVKRNYWFTILFIIFYLLEWFIFHPSLRYGGYHLFALLFLIPLVFYLEKFRLEWSSFRKRGVILILVTCMIFFGRNLARLEKEYNVYNFNIFENMNYKFIGGDKDFYYRYDKLLNEKKFNHDYFDFFGKKILVIKN